MSKPFRTPAATDFFVDVEGVGRFSFAQRKMADEMKISVEYSIMTQGIDTPTVWLGIMAGYQSQLKVLTVSAPDGWDLDEMDPLDDGTYEKIIKVHSALRDKENSFRKKPAQIGEAGGAGSSEGNGVLVPAQIQPGAD